MPTVASTPQHEQQCQGTTPVNLAFSAHLLNRKCWLCVHFFAQTSPGFQLLLCKQKGSARAVCVILLILTTIMFTFGGVLNAQEYHQISVPEKTDLPLPPLPTPPRAFSPHLPCQQQTRQEKGGLKAHVLWEQDWY